MNRYLIIDTMNLLKRASFSTKGDVFLRVGLAAHITFSSIRAAWNKFNATHVVFCMEGRYNWRKDFYKKYKANRVAARSDFSATQREEDEIFFEMANSLTEFLSEHSNCTVLQHNKAEADDFVARWIQRNNVDEVDKTNNHFIILSSDSDFHQLIDTNVEIYDAMSKKIIKHDGIFEEDGDFYLDKKGNKLPAPDPEYILFKKCIRGDSSDNVMSAYPGIREKGSSKKVGIVEAYADRYNMGYNWNNFMMQRWADIYGKEWTVKECYERNKVLIDLTRQPKDIIDCLDEVIDKIKNNPKNNKMIGVHFLRFCAKYDLENLSKYSDSYIKFLKAGLK